MSSGPSKKPGLKIQPKAYQRRTQEERQALAREEARHEQVRQRQAAEDAQLDKQARDQRYGFDRRPARGAGRGGRGGYMGQLMERPGNRPQQGQQQRDGASSSAAPGQASSSRGQGAQSKTPKREERGSRAARGGASRARTQNQQPVEGTARVKTETDGDVRMGEFAASDDEEKPEMNVPADDESDYGHPKDIDYINIESDEEEDDGPLETLPIRLRRREHVDRRIGINTESSASTATGARRHLETLDLNDDEDSDADAGTKGKGRRRSSVKKETEARESAEPDDETPAVRPRGPKRERTPTFQTEEEKYEWEMMLHNRAVIVEELLQQRTRVYDGPPDDAEAKARFEEDVTLERERAFASTANRDQNVFLFQLPPIMPNLVSTGITIDSDEDGENDEESTEKEDKGKARAPIKQEDDEQDDDDDVEMTDATTKAPSQDKANTTTQAKNEPLEFKMEDKEDAETAARRVLAEDQNDEGRLQLEPGLVGELRVHQSGKVTMDWGGVPMQVQLGMHVDFLQTAVMADLRPKSEESTARGQWEGDATAFGQVRGKFVVTPKWDELF